MVGAIVGGDPGGAPGVGQERVSAATGVAVAGLQCGCGAAVPAGSNRRGWCCERPGGSDCVVRAPGWGCGRGRGAQGRWPGCGGGEAWIALGFGWAGCAEVGLEFLEAAGRLGGPGRPGGVADGIAVGAGGGTRAGAGGAERFSGRGRCAGAGSGALVPEVASVAGWVGVAPGRWDGGVKDEPCPSIRGINRFCWRRCCR